MSDLNSLLSKIESKIPLFQKMDLNVSAVDIGWHIEHILLVLNGVTKTLSNSNPENYVYKFNLLRTVVLFRKKIPRGKGKAPDRVKPKSNYSAESLTSLIFETKEITRDLNKIDSNKYFDHPYFGNLTAKQTITFLEIHTNHHLKIIDDIIGS